MLSNTVSNNDTGTTIQHSGGDIGVEILSKGIAWKAVGIWQ